MKTWRCAFLAMTLLFGQALRASDSRFTFSAAQSAFQAARAPTLDDLQFQWRWIGSVNASPDLDSLIYSGYFPDGKATLPGWPGYFYRTMMITTAPDAFGDPSYSLVVQLTGAESGNHYTDGDFGPFPFTLGSTGMVWNMPTHEERCAADFECRITARSDLLLCSAQPVDVIDHAVRCSDFAKYQGKTMTYFGFMRLPKL